MKPRSRRACPRCADAAPNVCTCLADCGHKACAERASVACQGCGSTEFPTLRGYCVECALGPRPASCGLTVLEAHEAVDCPDRSTCWARDIHDRFHPPLTYVSLFAGIGGIDLGLDRAGMRCVGQVEIDPYCQRVLAEHWPGVPRHDDVRTAVEWWGERPAPDVVAGGFPCQPVSQAGLRRGITDERWLWPAMERVVRHLRPRYVLVENVAALVDDGAAFGTVLADLAALGFDAEWTTFTACAVGASHTRERLFLVAYRPRGDVPDQSAAATETRSAEVRAESRGSRVSTQWRARWLPEPAVDRVAHGLPIWMVRDALHALGNAVVPNAAEYVGRLIIAFDEERLGVAA